MELLYESFILVKTFLLADATVPSPTALAAADDRFIAKELEKRRGAPVLAIIVEYLDALAQPELLTETDVGGIEEAETNDVVGAVAPVAQTKA
jgi:hypothetical protein